VEREQVITIDLNPGERRLYDRMRAHLSEPVPGRHSGAGDLLLLLPDLCILLLRLLRDDRVPIASKAVALAGLGYVLSPLDFMPAIFFGPLGLIDDVVIAAAALSGVLNRVHPDVVRSHWSGQGDALDAIQRVTAWTEEQVRGGLGLVLGRLMNRPFRH